ncbi:MAG: pseudouridine-5'-phosphate glycosidase [Planctomycetota bacterium]|nr:pseudouridine-5'-phosphate glycosidase [Planctomycetota bacterium]
MDHLSIHPEIREALATGQPVVLLETAVTTSGLPRTAWSWPDIDRVTNLASGWQTTQPVNLELARAMSSTVRACDAIPATVAIMNGQWRVGLDHDELEMLALDETAEKASVTSAAAALRKGVRAGTTVSSSLAAANLVTRHLGTGLQVLATGGIGGVHHGWSSLPDISADLRVLARSPLAVVSAGVKSIVDVPATREWLETLGIPVLGLETEAFPCFIAGVDERSSRVHPVQDEREAAALARLHWETVDDHGGLLLAVPLSATSVLPRDLVEDANEQAEAAASRAGIDGPERTPFLLSHMAETTHGRSLVANIELLINNVRVASSLARHLQEASS